MNNATDLLQSKANKNGKYYSDAKYVRMACGTAYNGVLLALETLFDIKGMPLEPKRNSRTNVKDFERRLALIDKKLLNQFKPLTIRFTSMATTKAKQTIL